MYIERIRNYILKMKHYDEEKWNIFIQKHRNTLQHDVLKEQVKPSDAEKYINRFLSNRTGETQVKHFEAILFTIDKLYKDGSIHVLKGKKPFSPESWKDIVYINTKNYNPSEVIQSKMLRR
ncbi:hypothetical protein, partial [Bacillus piscicola]|uniref:hypothetical protein n=1 Tax=Bacillus piscicola TaxID=1632684 RepID=UPI001F08883B